MSLKADKMNKTLKEISVFCLIAAAGSISSICGATCKAVHKGMHEGAICHLALQSTETRGLKESCRRKQESITAV